jgi:hypothetical protein
VHVRVVARGLLDLRQYCAAFGIVGGAAACQHKLTVKVAFHDAVGAQHSDGVLQTVEARNLGDDAPARIDAEAREDILDKLGVEIAILVGKRIDGGIEKVLRNG